MKSFIETTIKNYDEQHEMINIPYRCRVSYQEVEKAINDMKSSGERISKKAIQRMIHCDHQALDNDPHIAEFIDQTIMDQIESRKHMMREAIQDLKKNGQEISIVAVSKKTGLSKKFIRLEENRKLIDEEISKQIDEKKTANL